MLEIRNFTTNEIDEKFFQKVARKVLDEVVKEKKFPKSIKQGRIEISLAIVGSARIRKLNKMYRGKNRVTDVLSFGDKSAISFLLGKKKKKESKEFIEAPDGVLRLGEIIICYPRAKKQAKQAEHSLDKELGILLIHGLLHLLDYDHEKNKKEAETMKQTEENILSKIAVKN